MLVKHLAVALGLSLCVAACGSTSSGDDDAGAGSDGGADARVSPVVDSGPITDAGNCQPPDMLFVLDRTMSMHRRPDGSQPDPGNMASWMESKWFIAITTIEAVVASLDTTVRFGLSLFPIDRGGVCVTLEERINGTTATNLQCEGGEQLVPPALNSGVDVANALDPFTTELCRSTPIGAGLGTALTDLAAIADPIREQFVTLITDGQDTCDESLSLANTQALAAAGVNVYVIGFDASGTGVDGPHLNDLACAGKTAPDFMTNCTDDGSGNFIAIDSMNGPTLYFDAGDATQLQNTLTEIAGEVCCDCIE